VQADFESLNQCVYYCCEWYTYGCLWLLQLCSSRIRHFRFQTGAIQSRPHRHRVSICAESKLRLLLGAWAKKGLS
jgi:hypothetical protein